MEFTGDQVLSLFAYLIGLVHGFTSRESIPLFIDSFLLVHNFFISFPVFCCLYMYIYLYIYTLATSSF